MLKDRVKALRETQLFAPRYLRHLVSAVRVNGVDDGIIRARANDCVLRTLIDEETNVLQTGRCASATRRSEAVSVTPNQRRDAGLRRRAPRDLGRG